MLDELSQLLDAVPGEASRRDYAQAVMEGNCLGKRTAATRKHSLQRLSELYGLDARLLLFRVLKSLWERHASSRPLLALLLALARDPLLQASARAVVATPFGHELGRQAMKDALSGIVEGRLNDATLDKVVRNASSSWTQSGHLRGRGRKIRQRVAATTGGGGLRAADGIRARAPRAPALRDALGGGAGCAARRARRGRRRCQETRAGRSQAVRAHDRRVVSCDAHRAGTGVDPWDASTSWLSATGAHMPRAAVAEESGRRATRHRRVVSGAVHGTGTGADPWDVSTSWPSVTGATSRCRGRRIWPGRSAPSSSSTTRPTSDRRDPFEVMFLNAGVKNMTNALTAEEPGSV